MSSFFSVCSVPSVTHETTFGMKRAILVLALFAVGCAGGGKVTQFSTIDALLAGVYDGDFDCAEVARAGNLGLGTFDRLDGEMVVTGRRVYQVKSDGSVLRAPGTLGTPFATVVDFRPDRTFRTCAGLSMRALEEQIDRLCPNPNGIYAIRLSGNFSAMKTRSVPAQCKPYPDLVVAAEKQTVFELGPTDGVVVGFRFPAYFKSLNVPGYHLHFLSKTKTGGGHILGMTADPGVLIEVQECRRFELLLPGAGGAFSKARLDRDRSRELQQVER